MRIGVTEIFVDDQDKARAFYTQILGFDVKDDAPYSDTARWLTVVSPEDPDGTQLLLTRVHPAAEALQRARRDAGTPALSLTTDNCRRTYEELTARGAEFRSEPQQMPYGGTDAVFEDGCGNLLNLHEGLARRPPSVPARPGRLRFDHLSGGVGGCGSGAS